MLKTLNSIIGICKAKIRTLYEKLVRNLNGMNGVNILFVLGCIFVPLLLISINYSTIHDFYEYSVPLNSLEIYENDFAQNFNKIKENKDAQCYTTPENYFCYVNPTFHENKQGVSYLVSKDNKISGEMHFIKMENNPSLFVIQNATQIKDDTVLVQFSNSKYFRNGTWTSPMSFGGISEKFEYSAIMEKFDTFVSHCGNPEGTKVTLMQYFGIQRINDVDYFVAWHTSAILESGINCNYPQIIQHSLEYDFGI